MYANRIVTYRQTIDIYPGEIIIDVNPQNTEFNFITSSNEEISKLFGQNHFTKQSFEIFKKKDHSFLPTLHNKPIYNKNNEIVKIQGLTKLIKQKFLRMR